MTIEIDGKTTKAEGDIIVRYLDNSTETFAAKKIDKLYINKDVIKSFHILKKDK